jgi:hypothetical protein
MELKRRRRASTARFDRIRSHPREIGCAIRAAGCDRTSDQTPSYADSGFACDATVVDVDAVLVWRDREAARPVNMRLIGDGRVGSSREARAEDAARWRSSW